MIPELRKLTAEDVPYVRPPEIQAALEELDSIPIEEVADRAENASEGERGFVPTECVLHFVRQSCANNDAPPYQALFNVLRARLMKLVPVRYRRIGTSQYVPINAYAADLQEIVLDKFLEILCKDREEYDERLDIYEARFNLAFSALRSTAKKSLTRRRKREKSVEYEDDSSSLIAEMEERLASTRNVVGPEEKFFRFELLKAIDQLPPDEKWIIHLIHVENIQIDAQDPETPSIAKLLNCTEKTVRNRRDRAYKAIREALGEGGSKQ